MITLPKTKSKPTTDAGNVTMLLYGAPKIGKSTFCSRFEEALFIATEPGLNFLETFNVRVNTWIEFQETLNALEKGSNFKTLVIDTVDNLWLFCVSEILRQYKIQFIGDLSFGKGYALVEAEFQRAINRLVALGKGLVFISHAYLDDVDTMQGKVKKFLPTIPEKARKYILPLVDIIGFATAEFSIDAGGNRIERRIIRTQPGTLWEAGDRTGRLPDPIPFKFAVFKRYFEGTPTTPSQPQQAIQEG